MAKVELMKPIEKGPFVARTRFLLLVLVVLCLMINWANILTFNFTIICMKDTDANVTTPIHQSNYSEPPPSLIFNRQFTNNEKSQAMAVVAAGALVANIPIVTLINWYGPRYIFTAVGIFGAISTALVPMAMQAGFSWFLGARVLQGIAFAGDMATFGHFITYWTYHKQYAFFTATLCVYVQLAPVFTNPVSGLLCASKYGWPAVYYTHAVVATVLFIMFFIFYRNDPNKHPLVNPLEREKIGRGRDAFDAAAVKSVPYKEILTSPEAWAVFIGSIGNFAGINMVFQFTPTYLNKVQGFQVVKTGFLAALPPLLQACMKEMSGISNDRIPERIMGETTKTKVYNSIAFFSQVFFFILLSFIPSGQGSLALLCIIAGSTMLGFNTGSLISGPYAPFVMGQISTGMTVTMLIIPLIVNPLTPNNTRAEWALAFYAVSVIIVICNIYYMIFAKGTLSYWAKTEYYHVRMARKNGNKAGSVYPSIENGKTTTPPTNALPGNAA